MEVNKTYSSQQFAVTFSDAIFWLMKWKWLTLTLIIICSFIGYYYFEKSYTPMYSATASMVINSKINNTNDSNDQLTLKTTDVFLAQKLVETYSIILKSNKVMKYVIEDLNLQLSPEDIRPWVELKPQEDTQVLFVVVTCNDAELSVNIANSLMKVAPQAMMETVEIGSVNILDEATLPKASEPSKEMNYIFLPSLGGLFLGIGITFLLELFFPKIKNPDDVENNLYIQTLGEIPHVKRDDILIYSKTAKNFFIQSYSMFRSVFKFVMNSNDLQSIIITSAVENEGKTTVSINLAISLAESKKSVLLIDGDLRRPSISNSLNLPTDVNNNMIHLLNGSVHPDECIVKLREHLFFIAGYYDDCNISDLLASYNFKALMSYFKETYDYIIIDTPPACSVSDALILSHCTDGVVLVVKQDYASLKTISQTVCDFEKTGAKIIGCVLNDIKRVSLMPGYKNKYYGYSKKNYSYGTVQDLPKKKITV